MSDPEERCPECSTPLHLIFSRYHCSSCGFKISQVALLTRRIVLLQQQLVALQQQLVAAEAIVNTLAKTKNGVPVTNNMRLYFRHPELGEIWDWCVRVEPSFKKIPSVHDADDYYEYLVSDCYDSREAAEAENLCNGPPAV